MIRRASIWVLLALASLLTILSIYFTQPADVFEMLVGFAVGTAGTLQWILLGAVLVLLSVVFILDRPASRTRRITTLALACAAGVAACTTAVRERGAYSRETVWLNAGSVRLEGTTYRPRTAAATKRPAILLLHGSGPIKRDAYHLFARRFVEQGIVVLNVDKQGVGGSSGKYYGDNLSRGVIETRAVEARAALEYLQARADVDTARIGVFSMSQGGWIVPLLLGGDSPARFGIVFSGVAVSSGEEGEWSDWTGEDQDHFGFKPPPSPFDELDRRLLTVVPSAFNPRPSLAQMKMPTIWMLGEWDSSAPTSASVRVLDTLQRAGVPIVTHVFPEANHGLMIVRGPRGKRDADFVKGLWERVFAWTQQHGITESRQK